MNRSVYILVALLGITAGITLSAQTNQRYYWVGGGVNNNWGTLENWSNTSGGTPAVGITTAPANVNTVIFDQNSFLNGDTVIIIDGAVQCDSFIVQNCIKKPYFDFGNNVANNISINGSMFLQKGTIFARIHDNNTIFLKFTSSRPQETISADSVSISFGQILFRGSNSTVWQLTGSTPFGYIAIESGTFDLNGYDISANNIAIWGTGGMLFDSVRVNAGNISISGTGRISFANAMITCSNNWSNSSNNNITAPRSTNSLIRIGNSFSGGNNNTYYDVEFYGVNGSHSGGIGSVYHNVVFYGTGTHSISNGSYINVNVSDGNCIINSITTDTLLFLGGRSYGIADNNVAVNNYFEAKPRTCGGQLRLYSTYAISPYTLTLSSSAAVDIEKALIHDLNISRPITAVKSYDWGNNANINFTTPDAGRDMYWTGGSGIWDDPTHWRLSDNWPANCIPTLADNVFFDNTSSSGTYFTVRVDTAAAYCNSMIWSDVPASSSIYIGSANSLYMDGSLTMSSTMSLNGMLYYPYSYLYFTSNLSGNTITSNGGLISVCYIHFQSVSGNGEWNILDNFRTVGNIYFYRGHLDLSGYNVVAGVFYASTDESVSSFATCSPLRTIDFHNDTINVGTWQYIGGQQISTLHSINSLIRASGNCISKGNDYYYNIEHIGISGENYCNSGTSYFNKITFNNSVQGNVNNGGGTIYPDSLIFATNKIFYIYKNLPVRKYLSTLVLDYCDIKTKLTGRSNATFQMAADNPVLADRVQVQNAEITDIDITNGPYDVTYCDILGNSTGWNNTGNNTGNTNRYYWVGGTGNWSDPLHWANTSGGVGGSAGCFPTDSNTVVFDDNSGDVGYQVIVDIDAHCDSMLWIGADSLKPYFYRAASYFVTINGSLELQRNMSCNVPFIFASKRPDETIKTNGVFVSTMSFNGTGGWILLDSLRGSSINHTNGTLDFNGQYVELVSFNGNTRSVGGLLIIKNSEIHINGNPGSWNYIGDLFADSSIIYCQTLTAEQTTLYTAQYYDVELYYPNNIASITRGKYNKVTILSPAYINRVETDTLVLSAASNYVYQFQDTLKVNKGYYGIGTPCVQIYLQSNSETVPAIFDIKTACANFPNDTLLIDNVYVHGIKVLTNGDNAKLKKGSHSPDVNKSGAGWGYGIGTDHYNLNWTVMEVYNSGGSTYFGDDKCVPYENDFSITLTSENFLPSYGAIFQWRKNNVNSPVIASTPNLDVTDSGTYFLTVDYGNGCMVTDCIHFTILSIDTISETICAGEIYDFYGKNLTSEGIYTHTFLNQYGCDSIIRLMLAVNPVTTTPIAASTCQNTPYSFAGKDLTVAGVYRDTLQTFQGCDSIVELTLTVNPLVPDFEIIATGSLCDGKRVKLTASIDSTHYLWNTGEKFQTIYVSKEGIYSVEVSTGLCQLKKEIDLRCICKIFIPNTFTPNGDGLNDGFIPTVVSELHSFSMVIYDRWGNRIWQTNTFAAWEGKINGKDAAAGVYAYVIEYSYKENPEQKCTEQGHVTLIR